MKRIKYILLPLLAGICLTTKAAQKTATLRIDTAVTYQQVTGFGGYGLAATWWANLSADEINTMYGKDAKQLGYNIMRVRIAPSKSSWPGYLSTIKAAKANGAIVFASPWTAPPEFKSNNSPLHGYVLEQYYPAYAQYLNDYYLYLKENGIELDAVSVQNEPDWSPDYEGTVWSAAQMISFIANHRDSIQCKLIAPEYLGFTRDKTDSILRNNKACAGLDIVGGHLYNAFANVEYPLAREKGKEVWMTEYLLSENDDNEYDVTWTGAIDFAECVNTSMLANMNAWVHYALKSHYGMMGNGDAGTTNGVVTKRGYVLSHFAKYVTGTTRVRHLLSDDTHCLAVSAYQTKSKDSIIVMAVNTKSGSYDLDIELPFMSNNVRTITTTASKNMVTQSASFTETEKPTLSVPAKSVVTFVFPKTTDRAESFVEEKEDLLFEAQFQEASSYSFNAYWGPNYVPAGWTILKSGKTYTSKQTMPYSRVMAFFSPESVITTGLYLQSYSSNNATATYGANASYPLSLNQGKYRLTYSAIGGQHGQRMVCSVRNSSSALATQALVIDHHVDGAWGTTVDAVDVSNDTLYFEIATNGNYQLRWLLHYQDTNAVSNQCNAFIGNIKLSKDTRTAIISPSIDKATTAVKEVLYYQLNGLPLREIPEKGCFLMKTIYRDGSVSVDKCAF